MDEALALELEAMACYLQILFTFFQKLTPDVVLPAKSEVCLQELIVCFRVARRV